MTKGISIILCCYNSALRLAETLSHLALCHIPKDAFVELLVIDNASSDDTSKVAAATWIRLGSPYPCHVFLQPKPGLSFARLMGIEYASYEYVLFCDDDNWLEASYLEKAFIDMEAHPEVGILGGLGECVSNGAIPEWSRKYNIYGYGPQGKGTGEVKELYGAGMVLRKSVFLLLQKANYKIVLSDRIGKSLASGGDYELCYAMRMVGYCIRYNEQMTFKHLIPDFRFTLEYLKRYLIESSAAVDIFNIYKYLLDSPKPNLYIYYLKVYRMILYHIKESLRDYIQSFFRDKQSLKYQLCMINYLYHFHRLKHTRYFMPKLKYHFANLLATKNHLTKFKVDSF